MPPGDALLKSVAARLQACAGRQRAAWSRGLSGDEFAILQTAVPQPAEAEALARRIDGRPGQPARTLVDGHARFRPAASIGICRGLHPAGFWAGFWPAPCAG